MKLNQPVKEVIILASAFVLICVFCFLLMSTVYGNTAIDINMHDTYTAGGDIYNIAGSVWSISILPAFFWLATIGYLIRAAIYKFKEKSQNIVLLICCACLNVVMLHYFELEVKMSGFIHSMTRAETLYPPLSALGNTIHAKPEPYLDQTLILFFAQIILILLLAIIAALTAKNWKPVNNAL